jgi:hypothetical protein
MVAEPIAVTLRVTNALECLGIRYAIGGSLASAVHGVVRATMDADLVADLRMEHVEPLVRNLGDAFYADAEVMRDAVRREASFNLVHLETMFKVDVFVAKSRPFDRSQLSRRELHILEEESKAGAYVVTAEDIILSKLEWYRMGNCASDRQWRDVLGVLRIQGDRLDLDYLRRMAATLDLTDLLSRARREATE